MSDFLEQIEPIAAEIRKQVFNDLERRVATVVGVPWSEVSTKVDELDRALQQVNAWRVRDQQGAIYLKIACATLAMYRTMAPIFDNKDKLLDTLKAVLDAAHFRGGMDAFLLERFGVSPDAAEEVWDRLCENYIAKARERYGCGWVFEQGIRDHKRFFVNVKKCALADFFLAHDAREVLYLLCASDYVWGDALEKYNIRFERPTTLAEGSDACRFQLFRMTE